MMMDKSTCGSRLWSRLHFCHNKRRQSAEAKGDDDAIEPAHGDPPSPIPPPNMSSFSSSIASSILTPSADPHPPSSDPVNFCWNPPNPISMELLNELIDLLTTNKQQLLKQDCGTSDSASATTVPINEYTSSVDMLLQALPADKKKAMQGGKMMMTKDSFFPILTQVLQGVSQALGGIPPLALAAMGCALLAWAMDVRYKTKQNSEDCKEILNRISILLPGMKDIIKFWQSQNVEDGDLKDNITSTLLRVVDLALKAVVLCDSLSKKSRYFKASFLRHFKASFLKDMISNLKEQTSNTHAELILICSRIQMTSIFKRQPTLLGDKNERIVGRQKEEKEAVEFLTTNYGNEVRAICLEGMGGIGKSTLGLAIFQELERRKIEGEPFVCCREEFPLDVKDEDLPRCQKRIIEKIINCQSGFPEISNTLDGRNHLRKELGRIKAPILLYIDNLLQPKDVRELLPKSAFLPQGLRILVTTRYKSVAESIRRDLGIENCKSIEMKGLEGSDANSLLMHHVLNLKPGEQGEFSANDDSEVKALKDKVLRFCDGLPLALKVVGASIANNNEGPMSKDTWVQVVEALESARSLDDEDELHKPLTYSIACLDDSLRKDLFDVVHYKDLGQSWDEVECMIGEEQLRRLVDRHLLERREYETIGTGSFDVRCHDVLQALIKRMARNNYQELHVSTEEELEQLQRNGLSQVVSIISSWRLPRVALSVRESSEMKGLRCLRRVKIVEDGEECSSQLVLPNLRLADHVDGLKHVKCSDLRVIKHCNNDLDLSAALTTTSVSKSLRYLQHYCFEEFELEAIAGCKDLRYLELDSLGFRVKCLPPSIGWNLSRLRTLILRNFDSMEQLFEEEDDERSSCLQNLTLLTTLELSYCPKLQRLPKGIAHLRSLQHLELVSCDALEDVPEGVAQLSALQNLELKNCPLLRSLPESTFQHMAQLQRLRLKDCQSLESLPQSSSQCSRLRELSLRGSKKLPTLPYDMFTPHMTDLQVLNFSSCINLESLPESVSELRNLVVLNLSGCSKLSSLPLSMFRLHMATSLRELNLSNCTALVDVGTVPRMHMDALSQSPATVSNQLQQQSLQNLSTHQQNRLGEESPIHCEFEFSSLETLDVSHCTSLQRLFPHCTTFQQLTELRIAGSLSSDLITSILHNVLKLHRSEKAALHKLRSLDLSHNHEIQSLPEDIFRLKFVRELKLQSCNSLLCLPAITTPEFITLEILDLSNCVRLESLPEWVCSKLRSLQELHLSGCSNLKSLPDHNQLDPQLSNLQKMVLSDCYNLESLPDWIFTSLRNLLKLDLSGCSNLKSLPDHKQMKPQFTNLEMIDLTGCYNLENLPGWICSNLSRLRELRLSGCSRLQSLPDHKQTNAQVSNLRNIYMAGCTTLECLPKWIFSSTRLESLNLSGCLKLRGLPDSNQSNMSHIDMGGCTNLECLPEWIFCITSLKYLNLSGCSNLQGLPPDRSRSNAPQSIGLETINMVNCSSLACLPEWICSILGSLEELDLSGCTLLQSLPLDAFQHMTNLRELRMKDCSSLQFIPESICELRSLEMLDLSGCSKLTNLPDHMFEGIATLKLLDLSDCISLTSVPKGNDLSGCSLSLRRCKNLRLESIQFNCKKLDLSGNSELKDIPESLFQHMTSLRELSLEDCSSLELLPDSICGLTNLRMLDLAGCRRLRVLPQHMFQRMISLQFLSLKDCSNINLNKADRDHPVLQEQHGSLELVSYSDHNIHHDMRKLERLDLSGNDELILNLHTWHAFQLMSNLQGLIMRDCVNLESLPESIFQLKSLKKLDISGWRNLRQLPADEAHGEQSSKLETLILRDCITLESLPCWVCDQKNLRVLDLSGCSKLQKLPPQLFQSTTALEDLSVRGCNNLGLESILCCCSSESAAGNLRSLDLSNYGEFLGLSVLPQDLFQYMSSLRTLKLEGYSKLRCLPESVSKLRELRELSLSGCKELLQLPESLRQLEYFRKLDVKDCVSLRQIQRAIGVARLNKMQEMGGLIVEGCSEEVTKLIFSQINRPWSYF